MIKILLTNEDQKTREEQLILRLNYAKDNFNMGNTSQHILVQSEIF